MNIWDMYIAPTCQLSFVVAGPTNFYAMSGDRTSIGRTKTTEESAMKDAQIINDIFMNCPPHQHGCAALAAMAVK